MDRLTNPHSVSPFRRADRAARTGTGGVSPSLRSQEAMSVLHRRLACLYAVTASLILTVVMAAFLLMRIRETRQGQLDDFYDLWNTLQYRLQSDTVVSRGYLAQTESANSAIIDIEENGIPLLYPGSWTPRTGRQKLIARVKALAEEENVFTDVRPVSSSSISSSLITFQGDAGETYHGRVLVLSYGKSIRSLCLISYVPPAAEALSNTFFLLFALELLGIAGLTFISWKFVGWSLVPVAESRQRQAEFVAAASHELRSPLAVLRSGASAIKTVLDNHADDPGRLRETAAPILAAFDRECARMSRLIDDLLLLASADAGTWKLNLSPTNMDTLLIETYESYLPLCRQNNISLKLDLPEKPLPALNADGERIRQVLAVLLDNAITYTPPGGEIRLKAELTDSRAGSLSPADRRRKRSRLVLCVTDQGPGIPDEEKSRVFDRFYRSDSARSGKEHYGLGLSIARDLILLHGGSIDVTDAKTGGSVFTVRLPVP